MRRAAGIDALESLLEARVAEARAALSRAEAERAALQAASGRLEAELGRTGTGFGPTVTVEELWGAVRWAGHLHTELSRRQMEELEISRRITELEGKLLDARRRREIVKRWKDRQERHALRVWLRVEARQQQELAAARFRRR